MANCWSDAPPEILSLIAGELNFYEDFLNFIGVCNSWRSAVVDDQSFTTPCSTRSPCLMLAEDEQGYRQFFYLSNGGGMIGKVQLPEARNQEHCVSTQGWLLTVRDRFFPKLLHPISRFQIELPRMYDYGFVDDDLMYMNNVLMRKVVFTTPNPSDNSFCVIVVWGATLAVYKPGEISWKWVNFGMGGRPFDMVYHSTRKRLYITTTVGQLFECDIAEICFDDADYSLEPRRFFVNPVHPILNSYENSCFKAWCPYLLEWDYDSLLIVTREYYKEGDDGFRLFGRDRTKRFEAFVFSLVDGKRQKVDSLGNRALFLGYNSSFYVNTSKEDGCIVVKPNCIYFTDDRYLDDWERGARPGGRDTGVYHMCDDSIKPLFDKQDESISHVSPHLWLETCVLPPVKKN